MQSLQRLNCRCEQQASFSKLRRNPGVRPLLVRRRAVSSGSLALQALYIYTCLTALCALVLLGAGPAARSRLGGPRPCRSPTSQVWKVRGGVVRVSTLALALNRRRQLTDTFSPRFAQRPLRESWPRARRSPRRVPGPQARQPGMKHGAASERPAPPPVIVTFSNTLPLLWVELAVRVTCTSRALSDVRSAGALRA